MELTRARARAVAILFQLAVVAGCGILGWRLAHPAGPASVHLQPSGQAPGIGFAPRLAQPAIAPAPLASGGPGRPGLSDLVRRVNKDDVSLYSGQWRAIQAVGAASREYIERRIVPLLLAAARGGNR